jgi:hypothetical protein
LIDDAEMTRISTSKRWAAVSLTTGDGQEFAGTPRTPRGDIDAPLSDTEIATKFHAFADPVLGPARATRIEALSTRFDALDTTEFGELIDLCLSAAE